MKLLKLIGLYWAIYFGMLILSYGYMQFVLGLKEPGDPNITVFSITAMTAALAIDFWRFRERSLKEEGK